MNQNNKNLSAKPRENKGLGECGRPPVVIEVEGNRSVDERSNMSESLRQEGV